MEVYARCIQRLVSEFFYFVGKLMNSIGMVSNSLSNVRFCLGIGSNFFSGIFYRYLNAIETVGQRDHSYVCLNEKKMSPRNYIKSINRKLLPIFSSIGKTVYFMHHLFTTEKCARAQRHSDNAVQIATNLIDLWHILFL